MCRFPNGRRTLLLPWRALLMNAAAKHHITFSKWSITADVNNGINTRQKLRKHDPQLAALLEQAFGDGEWRYQKTSPADFQLYGTRR